MKKDQWLKELDADERFVMTHAALIPLSISIDVLILATGLSALKILTVLEKSLKMGLLQRHAGYPMGMYRLASLETADDLLHTMDSTQARTTGARLIKLIEKHVEEGIEKDISLARLYALCQGPEFSTQRVLRTARYLKEQKKHKEAAHYYQSILDKGLESPTAREDKRHFIEATLGFVEIQGPHTPLPLQGTYLKQARKFAKQINTPDLLARINLIYARALTRSSGEMTQTARNLIEESCRYARQTGDPNIIRKSEIAKCGMLHWEGRVNEAIDRWDRTVGHLEDLTCFDEEDLHHLAALGWAYGICGKTARGVGLCEAALQKAIKMQNDELQCYINMMAGMILFEARRISEGESYFKRILELKYLK